MAVLKSMIPENVQGNSPTNYHIILPVAVTEGSGQCARWMGPDQALSKIKTWKESLTWSEESNSVIVEENA